MKWMENIMRRLPQRTVIIHIADGNARVGSIAAMERGGEIVVGMEGVEAENKSGRLL